jgi:hypothetical protein
MSIGEDKAERFSLNDTSSVFSVPRCSRPMCPEPVPHTGSGKSYQLPVETWVSLEALRATGGNPKASLS